MTQSSEGLDALLVRVEAATGADWELDRALEALAGDDWYISNNQFTASLDAALALCERVLPGWERHIRIISDTETIAGVNRDVSFANLFTATRPTPALALLAAMLKATIASASTEKTDSNSSSVAGLPSSQEGSDTHDIRQAGKED